MMIILPRTGVWSTEPSFISRKENEQWANHLVNQGEIFELEVDHHGTDKNTGAIHCPVREPPLIKARR